MYIYYILAVTGMNSSPTKEHHNDLVFRENLLKKNFSPKFCAWFLVEIPLQLPLRDDHQHNEMPSRLLQKGEMKNKEKYITSRIRQSYTTYFNSVGS